MHTLFNSLENIVRNITTTSKSELAKNDCDHHLHVKVSKTTYLHDCVMKLLSLSAQKIGGYCVYCTMHVYCRLPKNSECSQIFAKKVRTVMYCDMTTILVHKTHVQNTKTVSFSL